MSSERDVVRRVLQAALIAIPLLSFTILAWHWRAVVDDAYINFRIIENVLAGHGLVYNVGERVESGTSPGWLAILTGLTLVLRPVGVALPWISVVAGIAAGVGGLAFAQLTSVAVWRAMPHREPGARWLMPAGSLLVLALPPFWEFVASGLETGTVLLWIGASAWALVSAEGREHRWRALLMGVGPVFRPELAMFSGPFLVTLWWLMPDRRRQTVRLAVWALAIPVAVQIFRMGYYASLVPNTALAKEAFGAYWERGFTYLVDLVEPYWLLVPVLPLGVMALRLTRGSVPVRVRAAVGAVLLGGALNTVYVVRLGGDFMHARMLLPALFALVSCTALWPIGTSARPLGARLAQAVCLAALSIWAVFCATSLRVPYRGQIGPQGIADEATFYRTQSGHPNPVMVDDYRGYGVVELGGELRDRAARGHRVLLFDHEEIPLAPTVASTVVTDGIMIGVMAYVAGPSVHVADTVGLTDPLASRIRLEERGRAGHEKRLPRDWMVARYAAPSAIPGVLKEYPQADAARRALQCGALRALVPAVDGDLTLGTFWHNVLNSFALTRLRLPAQPLAAVADLCS